MGLHIIVFVLLVACFIMSINHLSLERRMKEVEKRLKENEENVAHGEKRES